MYDKWSKQDKTSFLFEQDQLKTDNKKEFVEGDKLAWEIKKSLPDQTKGIKSVKGGGEKETESCDF